MNRAAALGALLIIVTAAVFIPILNHPFVNWDDQGQLYENPDFNPPALGKLAKYWHQPHMNIFMPVTYTLWGGISKLAYRATPDEHGMHLHAAYFHAANLLLHLANVLLVFSLLRKLVGDVTAAALGAALFAIHPLQVEAVAWAAGFYTVLTTTFSLLTIGQFIKFIEKPRAWRFASATVFLALALLSKPSAVVVPLICAAIGIGLLRAPLRRITPVILAWLAMVLPIAWLANHFQPALLVDPAPILFRPIVALDALGFYFLKLIAPIQLATDYARTPQWLAGSSAKWFTWIIPAAIAVLAWRWRRKNPWLATSAVIFALGALPYLGLAKFDLQWFTTTSDRYVYLSLFAAALALAFLMQRFPRVRVPCTIVLLLFAVRAHLQTYYWRDTHALFTHTLDVTPDSLVARNVLAHLATSENRPEDAAKLYIQSLNIRPLDPSANYNFGNLLLPVDPAAAEKLYRRALIKSPRDAKIYNNLGIALTAQGNPRAAREAYERATQIDPDFPDPYSNLGKLALSQGDPLAAIQFYEQALARNPNFPPAQRGLAAARAAKDSASQPH